MVYNFTTYNRSRKTEQKSYALEALASSEVVPQEWGAQRKLWPRSLSDPTRIGSFCVHILTSKLVYTVHFFGGVEWDSDNLKLTNPYCLIYNREESRTETRHIHNTYNLYRR